MVLPDPLTRTVVHMLGPARGTRRAAHVSGFTPGALEIISYFSENAITSAETLRFVWFAICSCTLTVRKISRA